MAQLHPENAKRIALAAKALDAFTVESFGGRTLSRLLAESGHDGDALDALGDLLGDLMHLADARGLDFARAMESGRRHYEHESAPGYQGD